LIPANFSGSFHERMAHLLMRNMAGQKPDALCRSGAAVPPDDDDDESEDEIDAEVSIVRSTWCSVSACDGCVMDCLSHC
jgi:hypothetical protein